MLNVDGSSLYGLEDGTLIITGTWAYTPTEQEVSFTNFRWLTATYENPNRLWNSEYLEDAGFEIAISCYRR